MNTVKVDKAELLSVLQTNREKHRTTFLEAQEGFRKQVIEQLDRNLRDARNGKRINLRIVLPEPQDQKGDYDRVIGMLKMSVDTVVQLSEQEYSQYVMDDRSWKNQWTATVSNYR